MSTSKITDPFVLRLRDIIERHMATPGFSIEYLCREAGLSRSQLHRKVKAATGLSTSLYVRQLRLEHGADLLSNSSLNVSEVAYATGMSSPQNFSKYFQAAYGMSPTEWRQPSPPAAAAPAPAARTTAPKLAVPDRRIIYAGLALLAVSLLLFALARARPPATSVPAPHPRTVALLPLREIGVLSDDYLAEGINEDIRTQLSRFADLRVIANRTTARALARTPDPTELADRLGANYLLEGSIREHRRGYRLNLRLVAANAEGPVWGETYDLSPANLIDLQSYVASGIAAALGVARGSDPRLRSRATEHPAAYQALLRARKLRIIRTAESLRKAIELLDTAIVQDGAYAEAYAQRSIIRGIYAQHGYSGERTLADFELSDADARSALELDPDNATALLSLGRNLRYRGRNREALAKFERAIRLDPGNAGAHASLALSFEIAGEWTAALYQSKISYELAPLWPAYVATHIYYNALVGNETTARRLLREWAPDLADNQLYPWVQGVVELYAGQPAAALPHFERAVAEGDSSRATLLDLFYCRAIVRGRAGLPESLSRIDPESRWGRMVRAVMAAGYADREEALALLVAIDRPYLVFNQTTLDVYFHCLRDEPAYESLLVELGHGHVPPAFLAR